MQPVHARAYRFNGFNKRVLIQACAIFVGSVGFGLITMHVGLVAAIITHAAVDIVGLYVIKAEIRKLHLQS